MEKQQNKIIQKLWGTETILCNTQNYAGKILTLNKGFQSSLHYHKNKNETFFCLLGEIELEIGDFKTKITLKTGESIQLEQWVDHRFKAISGVAYLIEISTHDDPEDSYRIEKSRKILSIDNQLEKMGINNKILYSPKRPARKKKPCIDCELGIFKNGHKCKVIDDCKDYKQWTKRK